MYTIEDINKAKQYLSDNGYGTGSNFTLNTVANLMAKWAAKNCSIPAVINQRELLIDFLMNVDEVYGMHVKKDAEKCADNYLKSINSL